MAKEKKKLWVVESYDPDEDQQFHDLLPAVTEEEAVRETRLLRGNYAESFQAMSLREHINYLKRSMKYFETRVGEVEKVQREWDKFLKQEEPELVRDKNGRLVKEEDLEDDDE